MNENINLCEILKGREGIELYTDHFNFGKCKFLYIDNYLNTIVVKVADHGGPFYFEFNKYGTRQEADGSISHLFPSKEQRDWSKFERSIPIDTPMMVASCNTGEWKLAYYAGENIEGNHICFAESKNSKTPSLSSIYVTNDLYPYIIPYDKFDPNNIEESLKYNIQKIK